MFFVMNEETKNIEIFFRKPLDKFDKMVYNLYRCHGQMSDSDSECESGGTGRRARLRGVWFTPYGFKSRFPHQTEERDA